MAFIDLIFPKRCLSCKKVGNYVCSDCIKKVRLQKQICIECEKPAVDGITHLVCKRAWALDRTVSIWRYEGIIRATTLKLKYKFASEVAKELAGLATVFLEENRELFSKDAVLVPIPLARKRGNWRGFNQAGELGKLIVKSMDWEFSDDMLFRKISRVPQTELKGKERVANVRGVFSLNPKMSNVKSYGSIILFDDVLTTGATLREAGKVLKRRGAKSVTGLTVAG